MAGWQFIVVHQLDVCCLYQWLLWVRQHVLDGIHSLHAIQSCDTLRLLAHRALEQIPGRLVMMREWNNPSNHSQYRKRIDLHMRMLRRDILRPQSNQRIILLIDIQEIDNPIPDKIIESNPLILNILTHRIGHQNPAIFDH